MREPHKDISVLNIKSIFFLESLIYKNYFSYHPLQITQIFFYLYFKKSNFILFCFDVQDFLFLFS